MSESLAPARSAIKDIIIAVLITGIIAFTKGITYGRDLNELPVVGTPAAATQPAPAAPAPK